MSDRRQPETQGQPTTLSPSKSGRNALELHSSQRCNSNKREEDSVPEDIPKAKSKNDDDKIKVGRTSHVS
jgi:hypothetical protein